MYTPTAPYDALLCKRTERRTAATRQNDLDEQTDASSNKSPNRLLQPARGRTAARHDQTKAQQASEYKPHGPKSGGKQGATESKQSGGAAAESNAAGAGAARAGEKPQTQVKNLRRTVLEVGKGGRVYGGRRKTKAQTGAGRVFEPLTTLLSELFWMREISRLIKRCTDIRRLQIRPSRRDIRRERQLRAPPLQIPPKSAGLCCFDAEFAANQLLNLQGLATKLLLKESQHSRILLKRMLLLNPAETVCACSWTWCARHESCKTLQGMCLSLVVPSLCVDSVSLKD